MRIDEGRACHRRRMGRSNEADCHDHRSLHPPGKGVHPPSESAPGQASGRKTYRPAFAAQSAVQPKRTIGRHAFGPSSLHVHMPGLGGCLHASRDSLNPGWHNAGFRGFADYLDAGVLRTSGRFDKTCEVRADRDHGRRSRSAASIVRSEGRYPIPFQYRKKTEYDRILKGRQWP